jgi:hypothetical protein
VLFANRCIELRASRWPLSINVLVGIKTTTLTTRSGAAWLQSVESQQVRSDAWHQNVETLIYRPDGSCFFGHSASVECLRLVGVRAMLWRDLKVWQIYGANTNVGKTIVSTILCKTLERRAPNAALYLKPVSTGPLDEADDRHILKYAPGTISRCISQFSKPVSPHIAAQIDTDSRVSKSLDRTSFGLLTTVGLER